MIDAYRWATYPYRWWSLHHARQTGRVPVAVLFYHRVADDTPNPWTIGTNAFRQQIDWLQKNFDIVSLPELQDRVRSGCNRRPTVAITFDDGYADNSSFALPLLIQRGLPVTYFVTSHHLMTGEPFEHDVKRGGTIASSRTGDLARVIKCRCRDRWTYTASLGFGDG